MQISQALFGGEQLYPPPNKYTKTSSITLVNLIHPIKEKNTNIHLSQINVYKINKEKLSLIRIIHILNNRINKRKVTLLKVINISTIFIKKLKSTNIRFIWTNLNKFESKFVIFKFISFLQTGLINQIKKKNSSIKIVEITGIKLPKQKESIFRILETFSPNQTKQKRSILKANQIENVKTSKIKYTILNIVKISIGGVNKLKNTIILLIHFNIVTRTKLVDKLSKVNLVNSISTLRNQHLKRAPKATQTVSATVIKASSKKITSGITYTIGTSRRVTYVRQAKAVIIKLLNNSKSIQKKTIASSINTQSLTYYKIWRFVFQIVTKIISFNRQFITKPNYGVPNPDVRDPNMIDNSTPGAEGTIAGGLDDDSFIE